MRFILANKAVSIIYTHHMEDILYDIRENDADEFIISYVTSDTPFSNWSAHQIKIWGQTFSTSEHAFQYRKFSDQESNWAKKIKQSKSPYEAKKLAWQKPINPGKWNRQRQEIMVELVKAKTAQHEDVRQALIGTGSSAIVMRDRTGDSYWGLGRNGKGLNNLGKIWMHVREMYYLREL